MYNEFYIQISGHNSLTAQNPDLAAKKLWGNLPQNTSKVLRGCWLLSLSLLGCFSQLAFLPCKELWFSCRKTSGYLGKCVCRGGFVHAMLSTTAGAGADTKLLHTVSTKLEKVNLTLQWRDNLCHFNNLVLHCFHCRDWDMRFHGAEQHCACLGESGNKPLFSLLGKPHYAAVAVDPLEYCLRSSEITFKVHLFSAEQLVIYIGLMWNFV